QVQFSSQLKALELKFDADWEPLKKLNASLELDGKRMTVMVHDSKLNNMALNAIKIQIDDISQQDLDAKVTGKINTQSERLVEFLKRAPLDKSIHEMLNSINLSGRVNGDMHSVIPLDERELILDIDLSLKDNRLSVLDDKVVIEGYNSKLAFHHNKITATGSGKIRGKLFDIRINPNNKADDHERIFGVELIDSSSGFKAYITKQLDQSWRGRVESKSAKGNVAVFPNEKGIPNVRLLGLKVISLDAIKGNWKITPEDFPSMHLSAKNIRINEDIFPDFSVKLVSKDSVLSINNLQFEGFGVSKKVLSFKGAWDGKHTQLSAKAKGKNLAEFLQRLKVKEKVTGGEFDFDVSLACECAPWNMNYQDITGHLDINVKKGVFTDQDPNIGRILSLLNIKSIAKRLSLNFSDV
ncbi:FIG006388: Possible exported protein, partial [bacterium endosymbiont of Bathymodiolus sp. 5 South]